MDNMEFEIDPEMYDLFTYHEVFAVITNPTKLGCNDSKIPAEKPAFPIKVTMDDWTMDARVGSKSSATDYRNVVIFKNCEGRLAELCANPKQWFDAKNLCLKPDSGSHETALTGLSQWLQSFIAQAREQFAQGNERYSYFDSVMDDNPKWRGILVLRASLDQWDIPSQVRGLAAGLDLNEFEAHHFGGYLDDYTMAEDGSSLTVRLTRMFGLIDYGLPAYRVNLASDKNPDVPLPLQIEGNCGFTVLQLQVEFKNSEIIQFKSHIQLTIKKLVDSSVSKTFATFDKSPSNVVLLDGVFQKHGNISVYSFEKNEPTHHYVDSNILNSMTFKRVIFNTLNDGISDGIVRSRFLVWGTFSFDSLLVNSSYDGGFPYPFDLLSSSEENELLKTASTADGLEFSNLQIDLQSSLTSPSEVTFLFDTSAICLDSKQI